MTNGGDGVYLGLPGVRVVDGSQVPRKGVVARGGCYGWMDPRYREKGIVSDSETLYYLMVSPTPLAREEATMPFLFFIYRAGISVTLTIYRMRGRSYRPFDTKPDISVPTLTHFVRNF